MNTEEIRERVYDAVDRLSSELKEAALKIHEKPEIFFQEHFASKLLADTAEKAGFSVTRPFAGMDTAFHARAPVGSGEGPTVALLAEYDALPELGHGCGHNLIAAASLGGALAAAEALEAAEEAASREAAAEGSDAGIAGTGGGRIPGKLLLLGTPAEERGGGKVVMAEAGVFEDIDAVMMVHPATRNQLARNGLASRTLRIAFHGKASHAAAAPEKGINALDALIQTYNGINALRQQTADFTRIHGVITHGGDAANIIPDYTEAKFLVRALDDGECEKLTERVIACAQGAELATGARLEYENSKNCDAVKNNMPLARAFARNAERVGVVFDRDEPNEELGSTDMGNVSSLTAAIHPFLEIGAGEPAVHTVEFREAAASKEGLEMMLKAAKILGATAVDFLLDDELRGETAAAREAMGEE